MTEDNINYSDCSKKRYLGECTVRLAGTQFYSAGARAGEPVHLEREFDNPHDENAVIVKNARHEPLGHIPRGDAAWLAPLLDTWRVVLDGAVAGETTRKRPGGRRVNIDGTPPHRPYSEQFDALQVRLKIHVTERGDALLKVPGPCANRAQVKHEIVLNAFRRAGTWDSPDLAGWASRRLESLVGRGTLPETRMLLRLIEGKAITIRRKRRTRMAKVIKKQFSTYRIGACRHYRNLTLFPIFGSNGHEPGYVLLNDAIQDGSVAVTEISDEGMVNTLKVINRGTKPILVIEGEMVVGGKQNRIFNLTTFVEPHQERDLPVSCVEQGRWHHQDRAFKAQHFAPRRVRSVMSRDVHDSLEACGEAQSDQHAVWERVSDCLSEAKAESTTESLTAGFEKIDTRIEAYMENLPIDEGALGFLVGVGDDIVSMDIFDHAGTLGALWDRLSQGHFMECASRIGTESTTPTKRAEAFLNSLSRSVSPVENEDSDDEHFMIRLKDWSGGGMVREDRVCHVSAFCDADL